MYLNHVDKIPDKSSRASIRKNNKIKETILDFYYSDESFARAEFYLGEYSSIQSAYSSLKKAVRSMELPIVVEVIQNDIYLRRAD